MELQIYHLTSAHKCTFANSSTLPVISVKTNKYVLGLYFVTQT